MTAMVTALVVSGLLILAVATTRLVHRFEAPDLSRLTVRRGRHERFRGLLGRVRRHYQQVPEPSAGREQDDGLRS
ncbi:hypothetical protein [Streptomyces sp. TRM68416]|uniref:hypothetical protein n=1 Tax=Streptomyces sp. TRM68416 TaxID=2758412 RepID=UPI001661ECF4|nr:hypothetical protein [Streptomyces sp. TRM68416]